MSPDRARGRGGGSEPRVFLGRSIVIGTEDQFRRRVSTTNIEGDHYQIARVESYHHAESGGLVNAGRRSVPLGDTKRVGHAADEE